MKPGQGNLRSISQADIPKLFEIRIRTWHTPNGADELKHLGITEESVAGLLSSTHRGWLFEVGRQVVGFAIGDGKTGEMWVIAVLPEFESQGIGGILLEKVESWLFSIGWDRIWLTTDTDESLRAIGFYRRLGWSDWKTESGDRWMTKLKPVNPND